MSDEQTTEPQVTEVEREERRLERLRLVTQLWPTPEPFDEEPDGPAAA
jgi:hypothetical protein